MIRKPINTKQAIQCPYCGYGFSDGYRISENADIGLFYLCQKCGKETLREEKNTAATQRTPTVTCPFCHSTDCKKISASAKIGKTLMWGVLAAGSVGHTWHCNSCGSNFG